MLTEQEISRAWNKLFKAGKADEQSVSKAEKLLDELRAESPLRHRLEEELAEIRKNIPQQA